MSLIGVENFAQSMNQSPTNITLTETTLSEEYDSELNDSIDSLNEKIDIEKKISAKSAVLAQLIKQAEEEQKIKREEKQARHNERKNKRRADSH